MLSTVQNRKEHPAIRNSGMVSSSILSVARSERLFLKTRSSRTNRRIAYTAAHLSLSLFRLIYAPIYLLLLVSCNVLLVCSFNIILIEERICGLLMTLISTKQQILSYSFSDVSLIIRKKILVISVKT